MHLRPSVHPFFGAPTLADDGEDASAFAYIGVPLGSPYDVEGVYSAASEAPEHVREMSWEQEYLGDRETDDFEYYDFDLGGPLMPSGRRPDLIDYGDVIGEPRDLDGTKRFATQTVRSALDRGAVPLVVGGDHSVTSIVVAAYEGRGPVNVLHVDAHLDFRDEVDGVRDGYSSPIRRVREMGWVGSIVQVGLRGIGSARAQEVREAQDAGNLLVTARELHDNGVEAVLERMASDAPWYITVDVDGLDPSIAPGTGYPVPDGVTYHEAATLIGDLAGRGLLAGIDFTEIHPPIDVRGLTALAVLRLLATAMARSVRAAGREDRVLPEQLTSVSR
ncbi:MAG: arginase family protein [Actinomycetota bacterium]